MAAEESQAQSKDSQPFAWAFFAKHSLEHSLQNANILSLVFDSVSLTITVRFCSKCSFKDSFRVFCSKIFSYDMFQRFVPKIFLKDVFRRFVSKILFKDLFPRCVSKIVLAYETLEAGRLHLGPYGM